MKKNLILLIIFIVNTLYIYATEQEISIRLKIENYVKENSMSSQYSKILLITEENGNKKQVELLLNTAGTATEIKNFENRALDKSVKKMIQIWSPGGGYNIYLIKINNTIIVKKSSIYEGDSEERYKIVIKEKKYDNKKIAIEETIVEEENSDEIAVDDIIKSIRIKYEFVNKDKEVKKETLENGSVVLFKKDNNIIKIEETKDGVYKEYLFYDDKNLAFFFIKKFNREERYYCIEKKLIRYIAHDKKIYETNFSDNVKADFKKILEEAENCLLKN